MNQKIIKRLASCAILFMVGSTAEARSGMVPSYLTQVPDTIPYGFFEDEREARDSSQFTRKNEARDKGARSAMEYVMDKRYINQGESFKKNWYDHLFFDAGYGFEQLSAPVSSYKFKPLSKIRIGVGNQFDKLNSARLSFNGGWGYLHGTNSLFKTFGVNADYMYSLSSYFYGYNPSRLLNVSAIAGVGFRMSELGDKRKGSALDVHVGVQGKFYTGPHGYIAIEPYLGIGSDAMDLSETRNWRKNDMYYGVNFSYIYYIKNNLSRESRFRILKSFENTKYMLNDSTPSRWAQPWFVEVSNGLCLSKSPKVSLMDSKGLETTISVGKWFSPVIGLRLTGSARQTTWMKDVMKSSTAYKPEYLTNRHNIYFGGRLEAMFNPLGFKKDFDWNDRFGMYIVGGGELGWIIKNNEQRLSCHSESYTAGVNLWARLGQGLSVFVEPRYAFTEYYIPYSNYDANKVYSDDYFTINIGLRLQNHGIKNYKPSGESTDLAGRLSVGVGGGMNFFITKQNNNDKAKINYNGRAFVDYKLNSISSVEAAFEYVSISNSLRGYYWDCNNEYPDNDYLRVKKNGLMDYKYNYGFISANYVANLTELLYGPSKEGRMFEFDAFAGPAFELAISSNVKLTAAERLQENHFIEPISKGNSESFVTFNAGVRLRANFTKNISAWFTPTFYWMGTKELEGIDFMKVKYVETLNLGVQYNF